MNAKNAKNLLALFLELNNFLHASQIFIFENHWQMILGTDPLLDSGLR